MKKLFFIFAILTFFADISPAQEWVQTNGPGGWFNQLLFNRKKDIFLPSGNLKRSTDGGKNWENIAPKQLHLTTGWKVAIAPNQDIYLAGGSNDSTKIWKSTDNGESWNGMWLSNIVVESILISPDSSIYILGSQPNSTLNAVYKSVNFGKTWNFNPIALNGNIINIKKGYTKYYIDSNGTVLIFQLGEKGLIRSMDKGETWQTSNTLQSSSIACGKKGNIFMSTYDSAYHSSDDGLHWTPITPSPIDSMPFGNGFFAVNPLGRALFLGASHIAYSDNNGKNWTVCQNTFPFFDFSLSALTTDADSGFYFSGDYYNYSRAYFSNKPCSEWKNIVLPTAVVNDLIVYSDGTVFASEHIGIWHSGVNGLNWTFDTTFTLGKFLIDSQKNIFHLGYVIYRSVDSGKNWDFVSKSASLRGSIWAGVVHPSGTFFVANDNGIYSSTDGGVDWNPINFAPLNRQVFSLAMNKKGILYAGSVSKLAIFRSDNIGKTWMQFSINDSSGYVGSLIADIYDNVFASCITPFPTVYRSSDEGKSWAKFDNGLTCTSIYSMIELPDGTIAAGTDSGVFILPLEGCQWLSFSDGLWNNWIYSLTTGPKGELFAGSVGSGVFRSAKTFAGAPIVGGNLDPGSINFGSLNTDSSLCKELVIKNIGIAPLIVNSYTIVDPIPFSISQVSKQLPFTLHPNDSLVMTVCFHPSQTAIYSSQIIWNTDIDPSLCGISRQTLLKGVATSMSSVNTPSAPINFSVHPNPVSGNSIILTLPESQSQAIPISIYDVLGREVYQNKIIAGLIEFEIPIQNFPEGIYYARMVSGGVTVTEKFIKRK